MPSAKAKMRNHKNIVLILVCLFLTVMKGTGQSRNEWTIFRGNPDLTGTSRARIKAPLELEWVFQTSDAILAAPVIGNNTIYSSTTEALSRK